MRAHLALILLLVASAVAQSSPPSSAAKTTAPKSTGTAGACRGLEQEYRSLTQSGTEASKAELQKWESRAESCLETMLAQLGPGERQAAQHAFSLYQTANSELLRQTRAEDLAAARADSAQQIKQGAAQLTGVFQQLGLLSNQYDRLLDDVNRYVAEDAKFHSTCGAPSAAPPKPPVLPDKVEPLDCAHYHVGRYDACWPPDYDD